MLSTLDQRPYKQLYNASRYSQSPGFVLGGSDGQYAGYELSTLECNFSEFIVLTEEVVFLGDSGKISVFIEVDCVESEADCSGIGAEPAGKPGCCI